MLTAPTRGRGTGSGEPVLNVAALPVSVLLTAIVIAGASLRAAIRLTGESAFPDEGYTFYADIARNFLEGNGLCYAPGSGCAMRMPVYPLLLAALMKTVGLFPAVIIVQSLVGASIAAIAWCVGRALFTPRAALMAAIAVALNPYTLVHDTALQDTVVVNALMAGSAALLIASRQARWMAAAAGITLAAATLTSARVATFIPLAIGWAALAGDQPLRQRLQRAALVGVPLLLLVGGWMLRNQHAAGTLTLTTEGGEALYFGNGPLTFTHYPERSIDRTADEIVRLPDTTYSALAGLQRSDAALDAFYRRLAIDYIAANPASAMIGGLRKLWVSASGQLTPARDTVSTAAYHVLFATVHVLAVAGAWRARHYGGRGHAVIALLFAAFAVTTAVFWAHTSHKSYLDPFLFIYAAAALPPANRA